MYNLAEEAAILDVKEEDFLASIHAASRSADDMSKMEPDRHSAKYKLNGILWSGDDGESRLELRRQWWIVSCMTSSVSFTLISIVS